MKISPAAAPCPTSPCLPLARPNAARSSEVATEGRALVVAANKSDLSGVTPGEYAKGVVNQVEALMPDVRAPPVVSVCALNGNYFSRSFRSSWLLCIAKYYFFVYFEVVVCLFVAFCGTYSNRWRGVGVFFASFAAVSIFCVARCVEVVLL